MSENNQKEGCGEEDCCQESPQPLHEKKETKTKEETIDIDNLEKGDLILISIENSLVCGFFKKVIKLWLRNKYKISIEMDKRYKFGIYETLRLDKIDKIIKIDLDSKKFTEVNFLQYKS